MASSKSHESRLLTLENQALGSLGAQIFGYHAVCLGDPKAYRFSSQILHQNRFEISAGKMRGPICCETANWPFADASIDAVFALRLSPASMRLAVAQAMRVLRPGGMLVTLTPNRQRWQRSLRLAGRTSEIATADRRYRLASLLVRWIGMPWQLDAAGPPSGWRRWLQPLSPWCAASRLELARKTRRDDRTIKKTQRQPLLSA